MVGCSNVVSTQTRPIIISIFLKSAVCNLSLQTFIFILSCRRKNLLGLLDENYDTKDCSGMCDFCSNDMHEKLNCELKAFCFIYIFNNHIKNDSFKKYYDFL